jgi:hypothetical protein
MLLLFERCKYKGLLTVVLPALYIKPEVLAAVFIKMTVRWNVMPCSITEIYQRVGETY